MKNNIIYFLSCLVLAIGLESCSSDDSNDNALLLSVSIVDGEKQDVALGKSLTLEAKVEMVKMLVLSGQWMVRRYQLN